MTNSPGVNIAGTVSLFPVPGTNPPLANLCIGPPSFLVANPLPIPEKNCPALLANLIPANAVNKGRMGLNASATLINALARFKLVFTRIWNVAVSLVARIKAKNSSLTLVI